MGLSNNGLSVKDFRTRGKASVYAPPTYPRNIAVYFHADFKHLKKREKNNVLYAHEETFIIHDPADIFNILKKSRVVIQEIHFYSRDPINRPAVKAYWQALHDHNKCQKFPDLIFHPENHKKDMVATMVVSGEQ